MHITNDWLTLLAIALSLGIKHGLDADHLATIDGLSRFNAQRNRRLARWCGFLFSAGHGAVVVVASLVVGLFAARWAVPRWTELFGIWISIGILVLLGLLNLRAVLMTPANEMVRAVGLKGRFLGRLQHTASPLLIFGIGVLFALSFETLSQISLYALAAAQFGGWRGALVLSATFMLGMMTTDGLNGLWISHLIRRSDQVALFASRVMGLTVATLSLGVAAFSLAQFLSPGIAAWGEGKGLYFGLGVLAAVALSFAAALLVTRLRPLVNAARHSR